MNEFIPYEKMTKKQKKEFNATKRRTWAICPATRTNDSNKGYNRAKEKNSLQVFFKD